MDTTASFEDSDLAGEVPGREPEQTERRPRSLSLRAKGIITFILMVAYALLIGVSTESQREGLLRLVDDLEAAHRFEAQLLEINTSMARTLFAVNMSFSEDNLTPSAIRSMIEIEASLSLLEAIQSRYPGVLILSGKLHALVRDLAQSPTLSTLSVTRATLNELILELDGITKGAHAKRLKLLDEYRENYDRITLSGLAMLIIGLILIGAATAIFFSRLTWDIRKLEGHASDIVNGNRDTPLPVTRNDELGTLMHAVNRMQLDLRERERHIERTRLEQFHREKMVAVGSLAAQLAHEINNPIAAITGVASAISQVQRTQQCPNHGATCQPGLILEQARRISTITRQIADFTRPQALQPELLNLNELVRNTCAFVGYDRRFRRITLTTELDGEMPAVRAIADHLTQVLMNLLINAADALEEMPADYAALITARTIATEEDAIIEIADNAGGIDAETLAKVFDEYFTTKPAGKGTGLGLALSRELIEDGGGRLTLESTPGEGTTARIRLPLRSTTRASAHHTQDHT